MEVALYVRVSTNRQQQQQTIEQQLARLREHIAMQPDWHLADDQSTGMMATAAQSSIGRAWIGCAIAPP